MAGNASDGPDPLFELLLRQGDDALVLGQRLSEWCGRGPALEEDIALANTALDLIGQAQLWLGLAGEREGRGRAADDLAMRRDAWEFRNLLLLEQPNRDFGHTMMRQVLFDAYHVDRLGALAGSSDARVADIAAKAAKEAAYHLTRSSETVIALGDGTEESHRRMQAALDRLWPYAGEMFVDDALDRAMAEAGVAPLPSEGRTAWDGRVDQLLDEATLRRPEGRFAHSGGRDGRRHTEHLGHLLSTMQWLQRAYPGASW
jgi:ring-1,2-phenylacetyl-CoA epoxidase subunit PaaC